MVNRNVKLKNAKAKKMCLKMMNNFRLHLKD